MISTFDVFRFFRGIKVIYGPWNLSLEATFSNPALIHATWSHQSLRIPLVPALIIGVQLGHDIGCSHYDTRQLTDCAAMIPSFASLAAHDLLNQFKKPSKQSAKSDLKLDNSILAFRTITTMLALIQCPTETTTILPVHISKPQRKELRVLDALAALLIRQYEKVAIMAKPYDGKSISVISVVNFNNPGSAVIEPASGSWAIRWLASLNSRHTQPLFPENDEDSMRVVDPDTRVHQTLEEHRNNPDKLLKTFLLTQW